MRGSNKLPMPGLTGVNYVSRYNLNSRIRKAYVVSNSERDILVLLLVLLSCLPISLQRLDACAGPNQHNDRSLHSRSELYTKHYQVSTSELQ